ncbi:GCG_CRPN prefix-to-repeats domain-containing protein [Rhizobium lusitanum]|uniref:Uncharacterized protein n=1 Tax=Rhizobium lusitanum TaxID=293958 RepID=A0A7X0IVQ3_9HYPH|nr:hypothetical protein [Rhizobium lusitanum]MBB6486571.1 hypothetical protein [Rhizobium lusitanum]
MNRILITSTLLAGCFLGGTANAMPALEAGMAATEQKPVLVDYACGPGWHLTRWGNCRRNYWQPSPGYGYRRGYYGWYGPPGWRDRGPPPGWRHHHHHENDDDEGDDD